MAGNIKRGDAIPSKDRVSGLDRSDEEMQRASESGVGRAAEEKRASDHIDPKTGQRTGRAADTSKPEGKGHGEATDTSDCGRSSDRAWPAARYARICFTASVTSLPLTVAPEAFKCFIATPVACPSFAATRICSRTGVSASTI